MKPTSARARDSRCSTRPVLVCLACLVTMLALSVSATGSIGAITPKSGVYKGKSAQGYPVKFAVKNGYVGGFGVLFTVSGPGGCKVNVYRMPRTKVSKAGTFKMSDLGITVKGRFTTATTVKGTLAGDDCGPPSVAFSARRAG
jgi:hypothetical protein